MGDDIPFGKEWRKQVEQLPKKVIIDWYRDALIRLDEEKQKQEEVNKSLNENN